MFEQALQEKITLIEKDVKSVIEYVESLKVIDQASKNGAVEMLAKIKSRIKRIDFLRHEFVDGLNAQVKKINNTFKMQIEPLEKMENVLKVAITKFMEEEERKARAEAERVRKEQEAKEKAEQERIAKMQAEEERLRKEAEAAKNEEERKKLEAEAEKKKEEAEKAEEQLAVTPIEVVDEPEKTVRSESGTFSLKKVWKWEVENEELLRKAHPELFILDIKAVNKLVQSGKREIAGVKIYQASEGAMRV